MIGGGAFASSGITSIAIPESVTELGGGVFTDCKSLANVTMGQNITALSSCTFRYSDSGSSERGFFDGCSALRRITLPSGINEIGYRAFAYSGLTEIAIPASVTSIEYGAFAGCSALKTVTFGQDSKLSSIGECAFYNCSELKQIAIPKSVTLIKNYAFNGCTGLQSVTFEDPNDWYWHYSNGSLNATDLQKTDTAAHYLTSTYCEYSWEKETSDKA